MAVLLTLVGGIFAWFPGGLRCRLLGHDNIAISDGTKRCIWCGRKR